jgi:hypothetical protein
MPMGWENGMDDNAFDFRGYHYVKLSYFLVLFGYSISSRNDLGICIARI